MKISPAQLAARLASRVVAYRPLYAAFTGTPNAGLLLAQLLYWRKRGRYKNCFYKTMGELSRETGLSESMLKTARKKLVELGLIAEEVKNGRIWFKLNLRRIASALLTHYRDAKKQYLAELQQYQAELPGFLSTAQESKQPAKSAPPAEKSADYTDNPHIPHTVSQTPPQTEAVAATPVGKDKPRGGGAKKQDWSVPAALQRFERVISAKLKGVPAEDAQAIVSTLDAACREGGVKSPMGYLSGILRKYHRGEFTQPQSAASAYRPVMAKPPKLGKPNPQGQAYQLFRETFGLNRPRDRDAEQRAHAAQVEMNRQQQLAALAKLGI